jgi:23S rRNA pseudouridine1911/1915/1917 synthase
MGVSPRGIEVLHEDDQLIALVKPAGLPTANVAAGEASVYEWLRRRFEANGFIGIVSRLDAPVSGVLIVAKTPSAAARLSAQFRERTVEKVYLAIVTGRFPAPLGEWVEWQDMVSRPPGDPRTRIRSALDPGESGADAAWRPAVSSSRVVRRAGEVSLVELVPATGRRHQLRVQLASRGCPIVGDRLYGSRLPFRAEGVALHASRIALIHPGTGRQVVYDADVGVRWRAAFPSLFS